MSTEKENPNAFKNLIHKEVIHVYAQGIQKYVPHFNKVGFLKSIPKLKALELRARVKLIAHTFEKYLPGHFSEKITLLIKTIESEDIKGFALWPVTEFIQIYGLDHFEESFQAMQLLTMRFTSEFSVRPFILKYPEKSLKKLECASQDPNFHLRRWASEGSRPRLPWGERLHFLVKDPRPTLRILDQLKFDSELYVRKSVSNHLNDITKDHPEYVIKILKRWKKEVPKNFEKEFQFILKQSLRTLIKNGHPEALKLLGIDTEDPSFGLVHFELKSQKVKIGHSLEFNLKIMNKSNKNKKFIVDYSLFYLKSNGKKSPKVFKIKNGHLAGNAQLEIKKKHSFKLVTTRVYYPGPHEIQILINGIPQKKLSFELLK